MSPGAIPRRPATDVALFTPTLGGGGAQRVMLDLAAGMAERGFVTDLIVASGEGALLNAVPEDVRLVDLGQRHVAPSFVPMIRYLRRCRPGALLSTQEHANVVAVAAARLVGGTRVYVRHQTTASPMRRASGVRVLVVAAAMRILYPRADGVIAVSNGVADGLVRYLGLRRESIETLPNPVISRRLREGADAPVDHPWFAPTEPPVVLAVGRLSPEKGFDTLVRAFALARRQHACRLVILGNGAQREELLRIAVDAGVAADVDLPGFEPNPFPYMAHAGVFVLSSLREGLPNVLVQALALSTPVVSTDCDSGPDEILEGGRHGRLVPTNDPEAMAAAIVASLEGGRTTPPEAWLRRYAFDEVVDRYVEVLGLTTPGAQDRTGR